MLLLAILPTGAWRIIAPHCRQIFFRTSLPSNKAVRFLTAGEGFSMRSSSGRGDAKGFKQSFSCSQIVLGL